MKRVYAYMTLDDYSVLWDADIGDVGPKRAEKGGFRPLDIQVSEHLTLSILINDVVKDFDKVQDEA